MGRTLKARGRDGRGRSTYQRRPARQLGGIAPVESFSPTTRRWICSGVSAILASSPLLVRTPRPSPLRPPSAGRAVGTRSARRARYSGSRVLGNQSTTGRAPRNRSHRRGPISEAQMSLIRSSIFCLRRPNSPLKPPLATPKSLGSGIAVRDVAALGAMSSGASSEIRVARQLAVSASRRLAQA